MNLKAMVLRDPAQRLPMPDRGGRLFAPDGETVDLDHPFYSACLADGSIQPPPEATAPAPRRAKRRHGARA